MIVIRHSDALQGRVAIVELNGSLNSVTCNDFEEYANELIRKNINYMILDAKELDHISSEGIGVFLYIQQKLSMKNGYFIIFNLADEVKSLCDILGFDKVFRIAGNRIEALEVMDRQIELRQSGEGEQAAEKSKGPATETASAFSVESPVPEGDLSRFENEIVEQEKRDDAPQEPGIEFDPFIVECGGCRGLIRVKKSGDYLCPDCRNEFSVLPDQTVNF